MSRSPLYNGRRRAARLDRDLQSFRRRACALTALFLSFILAARTAADDAGSVDAFRVFECKFDEQWDENFDGWPDRWIRRSGIEYPHYVRIAIQADETAAEQECLQIELDGASAAIASPPIRVMSRFSYAFEALVKCERLEHSTCTLSLDFCDAAGRVLMSESQSRAVTKGWERIAFTHLELTDPTITHVVIGLKVARGSKGDLHGRVSLDEIWLARQPRIVVSTNNPCNVYTKPDEVEILCELSGIQERDPQLRFKLFDALNNVQDAGHAQLNGQLIVDVKAQAAKSRDGVGQAPDTFEGRATWQPKIADYGYYRVEVQMVSSESTDSQTIHSPGFGTRTISFAMVPPLTMPRQGEFGWTLPTGDHPLKFQDLSRLLPQVGINWVKLPVWFDADDPRRGDDLIRFVELLGASNIETVGIIDQPPKSAAANLNMRDLAAADLLLDTSAAWLASLEPVMSRLALRIRWWQLGKDGDTSFADVNGLVKRIDELRTMLFRFGQDVNLGMNWDWDAENAIAGPLSWDFEQLCIETQPTDAAFDKLLSTPRPSAAEHWIPVEPPLPLSEELQYDPAAQAARASEFVRRLVLAKVRGADRIFVSNPFDTGRGLLRHDGMPGELLLPWRTTAAMLGGAKYLGQMQLPKGSENRIFVRPDGKVVMVLWNAQPTRETLFLGSQVQCFDLHGRSQAPPTVGNQQHIDAGPQPTFVLGLHEAIARWRMSLAFEKHQVPSVYNRPHRNSLTVQNFFPQGVGGILKFVVQPEPRTADSSELQWKVTELVGIPDSLTVEPDQRTFALEPGKTTQFPFQIRLKNAYYGPQPIRLDFTVQAEEEYSFSAYMQMEVGTEDLILDVKTHVDEKDMLVVEQFMANKSDRLADFRCILFPQSNAKDHRRQRTKVYRLGPKTVRNIYRLPRGSSLVGSELLLEIEEINGPRYLKYRFIATAEAPGTDQSDTNDSENQAEQDTEDADEPSRLADSESLSL
jgi:hypothetical protein